jgi:Transcriptional regulator PadR-like family
VRSVLTVVGYGQSLGQRFSGRSVLPEGGWGLLPCRSPYARHASPQRRALDDEEAVLRFLRDQLLQQASYIRATHDNRHLRAQMTENTGAIRDVLERLADRGYVERRTGWFTDDEPTTYAYRLTEQGDQALASS